MLREPQHERFFRPLVLRHSKDEVTRMPEDPYAAIADLYDFAYSDFDDDIDFYENLARAVEGPVLELGVGSGRVRNAARSESVAAALRGSRAISPGCADVRSSCMGKCGRSNYCQ